MSDRVYYIEEFGWVELNVFGVHELKFIRIGLAFL